MVAGFETRNEGILHCVREGKGEVEENQKEGTDKGDYRLEEEDDKG